MSGPRRAWPAALARGLSGLSGRWRESGIPSLVSGVLRVTATRGLGSVLQFAVAIVLGGGAGPAVLGVYYLYLAWSSILAKAFGLGHSTALMREGGRASAAPGRVPLERRVRHSTLVVATAGVVGTTAILLAGEPALSALGIEAPGAATLLAAGLGGLATALSKLGSDTLKGLHRAHLGLFYEFDLALVLFLGFLLAAPLFGLEPGAREVVFAHAGSMLVTGALCLAKTRREAAAVSAGARGDAEDREPRRLVHGAYWGVSAANHLFAVAPYVVLPFFASAAEIGVFGVVHRLVAIAGTLQVALGSFFAPRFVGHGDHAVARSAFRAFGQSQVCSILMYLPFFALYVFLPEPVLRLFGEEFPVLAPLLVLLAVLRFGNAVAGPAEYFLNMTGRGRLELASGALGLAVFFVASLALRGTGAGVYRIGVLYGIAFLVRGLLSLGIIYALGLRAREAGNPTGNGERTEVDRSGGEDGERRAGDAPAP